MKTALHHTDAVETAAPATSQSDLSDRLSGLTAEQRTLLALRLKAKRAAQPDNQQIPRQPRAPGTNTFPPSFAQQRLWFLDQLMPGSPFYSMPAALRLTGQLDLLALQRSINAIALRHETLRTTFAPLDGQPMQVVAPALPLPLTVADLRVLPPAERETLALELAFGEASTPFDLARGPLVRSRLLRLDAHEWVLLLTMHHIVCDIWSIGVLIREAAALYQGFVAGRAATLPALPIQYADFAVWQRRQLQGAALESLLAYWRAQLASPPALNLPTDRPRPAIETARGATQQLALAHTLSDALKALSQREDVTLFMTLLAAFKAVLARYTGQHDLLVGTPIANRTQPQCVGLIGFFVNTLVLRSDLSGNPSFRALLGRVRECALGAYIRQDVPFEMLVQELMPQRDLSRNPLFQVLFALQNAPMPPLTLSGLTISPLTIAPDTAKFDLSLDIVEDDQRLTALLEYSTDLFDSATITRMLGHLQTLLRGVVADPARRLADLPLLTAAERQQLLDWNDTGSGVRGQGSGASEQRSGVRVQRSGVGSQGSGVGGRAADFLHKVFEAQAERTPDAVALVYETKDERRTTNDESALLVLRRSSFVLHLTYGELNRRANQLAQHLRALGVRPEARVAVYMERSLALVIGVLGVLKAGGVYIPLDPAHAQERLAFIVADAQVSLVITTSIYDLRLTIGDLDYSDATIVNRKSKIVNLDADWPAIARQPESSPITAVAPTNLAYVIYTSGSTGRPKGVMIAHQSLAHAYRAWERAYALGAMRCHLQLASPSFDVFSGDLTRALCSGAKLLLFPQELLIDPRRLYDLMRRERVDCAEFVPSVLRNLLQHLDATGQSLDFMRLLIVGSDTWYGREHTSVARHCAATTRLLNSYGVTEATIDSSYFEGRPGSIADDALMPIGRPLSGIQMYLLDRHMQPTPIGVAGELYIGGAGLARGYLGRPDLTAERFVPSPWGSGVRVQGSEVETARRAVSTPDTRYLTPDTRLYRTGDLARYRPDGQIEFLGRIDFQVKLRGLRIELGEIETLLCEHPAIREAAVSLREDRPGQQRLVAYVVPTKDEGRKTKEEERDPSFVLRPSSFVQELRAFLGQTLPAYMVPTAFVLLDAMPLTPNGKRDHQALPVPALPETADSYVAPGSELEHTIADIWRRLLGVEHIGIHDNFFALGGHSLLAPQLVFQLQSACQVTFPLRQLFAAATIAEQAQTIAQLRRQEAIVATPATDLRREVILDPAITPRATPRAAATDTTAIFLTGATGFLGAYLLHELLQQTQAEVYCLVRADSDAAGARKIERNLAAYRLGHAPSSARIIPVAGDLAQPQLGLDDAHFRLLAQRIGSIYHCGAWVNFTYPYQMLKPTNVLGTHEVLRLAAHTRIKPVHFISTLSVFAAAAYDAGTLIHETDPHAHEGLADGYAQSKWVAEQVLLLARARGLPVWIYRPGLIGGDRQTGIGHTKDLLWAMIKGCIQLGSAPAIDLSVDVAPVDYVSSAIIHLARSRQHAGVGSAFHLSNPRPIAWTSLVGWMRAFGYPLRLLPYAEWQAELIARAAPDPTNALNPFIPLFPAPAAEASHALHFDCQSTRAGLAGTAIDCPPIDSLLATYFVQLIESGFLPAVRVNEKKRER